ncbi:hypothetical protein Bca52824_018740 [Brassica carinata]|uniref:RING-type domain-containing protein n=1 Tax=Brassica carinata TaxID=52824 RepID=A0A8X7VPE7_BRACI|nr:hypothetical protein Bca52824_018737 [Brassica carinata]KAG2315618.1 hypothetical protein Bca52824_018740 [Brassica carinata]
MAVEAHHLNPLCSPNVAVDFPYREMMHPLESNGFIYNNQFRYGSVQAATTPFSPTVECQTSLLNPVYNISPVGCSVQPMIHSVDSSITFNSENNGNNVDFLRRGSSSSLRKRPREESLVMPSQKRCIDPLMFLGQDLSSNVQHHSFDIDRLISSHVEIMRMEIEEKRNTQSRKIKEAIEQGLMKKLRAKDEEINHIGKLNLFLEEKVKSLYVENQLWRDVAQSNEATVNALRSNLQQVLADVERREEPTAADDTQSCCGSNDEGDSDERWRLVGEAQDTITRKMCRSCGKGEASVLLLPCRHMCLCTVCGSSLNTCPVCKSPKNASLHVNLSS